MVIASILDVVYGEPWINLMLDYTRIKFVKINLQEQSKASTAYGSDSRVYDQLDWCFCLPLELLSIALLHYICELKMKWYCNLYGDRSS